MRVRTVDVQRLRLRRWRWRIVGVRGVAVRCRPRAAVSAVGAEAAAGKLESGPAIVAITIRGIGARIRTTASLWLVAVRCQPLSAIRAVGAELAVHKLASGSAIVASTIKGVPADVHAMQILSHRAAQLKDEQHAMFHHFAPENTRL